MFEIDWDLCFISHIDQLETKKDSLTQGTDKNIFVELARCYLWMHSNRQDLCYVGSLIQGKDKYFFVELARCFLWMHSNRQNLCYVMLILIRTWTNVQFSPLRALDNISITI